MSSVTLHFPSVLESFLRQRTAEGFASVEDYFLTLAETERRLQSEAENLAGCLEPGAKSALDHLLARRSEGPFEPLDTADSTPWEQIKQEGRRRAAAAHA